MMTMHARFAFLVCIAAAAAPATAHAQTNVAEAEKLFNEGVALMDKKEYATACAKFEASQTLDPVPSTLLNLANCREKNGQLASAWGHFLQVKMDTDGEKKWAQFNKTAIDRARKLEARVSYMTINVPDDNRVPGLEITRNGEPVPPEKWNQELPIDGGNYEIAGKAPGHETWSTTVTVENEKDRESVTVPKFKEVLTPPDEERDVDEPERPARLDAPPSGMTGKRKAAIGVGIGGVVLLGVGGFFELGARSTYDDAVEQVDEGLRDDAIAKRRNAFIAAGAGAACLGVAAFLWFTGAATAESSEAQGTRLVPQVGPDGFGLALTGSL
jgi:hypothetical protein